MSAREILALGLTREGLRLERGSIARDSSKESREEERAGTGRGQHTREKGLTTIENFGPQDAVLGCWSGALIHRARPFFLRAPTALPEVA